MSDIKELQDDEREALISIYEGDNAFKQINSTTFQYKYGEEDNNKSFLIEILWGDDYPNELPKINLDCFYNRNLIPTIKNKIVSVLEEEGQQWIGCGMTYTLFECLKERVTELLEEQPETIVNAGDVSSAVDKLIITETKDQPKAAKKEQLTKAQKRRQWERSDHKGEKPRGWNWVDIVKHLSQTGYKDEPVPSS